MAEITRKRVTLHPLLNDGSMDLTTNLYPKTFIDGIVDRDGNEVQVSTEQETSRKLNNVELDWNASTVGDLIDQADLDRYFSIKPWGGEDRIFLGIAFEVPAPEWAPDPAEKYYKIYLWNNTTYYLYKEYTRETPLTDLQTSNYGEFATSQDLNNLRTELTTDIGDLRTEVRNNYVSITGEQTISGNKVFQGFNGTLSGNIDGNGKNISSLGWLQTSYLTAGALSADLDAAWKNITQIYNLDATNATIKQQLDLYGSGWIKGCDSIDTNKLSVHNSYVWTHYDEENPSPESGEEEWIEEAKVYYFPDFVYDAETSPYARIHNGELEVPKSSSNTLVVQSYVEDNYIKLIDRLPNYSVSKEDNIISFISSYNLNKTPLILVVEDITGGYFLGMFRNLGGNGYCFAFENLNNNQRYQSAFANLSGKTFGDLFDWGVYSSPYKNNYELQSNKATSITDQSTDTQYPSAKAVYDLVQAIKKNSYISVDITEYPTLQDFLASTGEEGYLYLYPIDTSDLSKGYHTYIYEVVSNVGTWVYMGDTSLDLTNYTQKNVNETITGEWVFNELIKTKNVSDYQWHFGSTSFNYVFERYAGSTLTQRFGLSNSSFYAQYASDLGYNGASWRNLYLSGGFNPNANSYKLTLPDTTNFTTNSEIVDTASDQTITGTKTFGNQMIKIQNGSNPYWTFESGSNYLDIGSYYSNAFRVAMSLTQSEIQFRNKITPNVNNSYDLGTSSYKWKDLYLSGIAYFDEARPSTNHSGYLGRNSYRYGTGYIDTLYNDCLVLGQSIKSSSSSTYGLTIPDTTSYTADSELIDSASNQTIKGNKTIDGKSLYIGIIGNSSSYTNSRLVFGANNQREVVFQPTTYYLNIKYYNSDNLRIGDGYNSSTTLQPLSSTNDLGTSNDKWRDIYLSNSIKNNNATYGLTLPDMTSWTADSELVDTNSDQTISGVKTFSNGVKIGTQQIYERAITENGEDLVITSQPGVKFNKVKYVFNAYDNTADVGKSDKRWKDGYFAGQVYAQNTYNVINASDIGATLTDEQIATLTNGKITRIIGTFNGYPYAFLYPPTDRGGTDAKYIGKCLVQSNGQSWQETNYKIEKSTKVISITTTIGFSCEADETRIAGLKRVNGKAFPNYPPDTGSFVAKSENGTITWRALGGWASNTSTELKYDTINEISINADTTYTLKTPANNSYPEYKANITNTDNANAITITLTGVSKIKTNDSNITIVEGTNSTFTIPADSSVELNIQNGKAIVFNWEA